MAGLARPPVRPVRLHDSQSCARRKQIRPPDLSQRADRETYVPSSQLRHQDGGGITPMRRRPAQETTLKVYFKDSLMKMAQSPCL